MRPRTSPSGSPRSTTSSPSSRKVRVAPSPSRTGSLPFQVSSIRLPSLLALGAGDRARRHQVARCGARAVRGRVRELLRHRPVEARARSCARSTVAVRARPRAAGRGPVAVARRCGSGAGSCAGAATRRSRAARAASPRREIDVAKRLAEERAERQVLPRLDVARAPVVDEHDAEDVLERALDRHRLAVGARHADDEAELELDVEPSRRAERRARRPRRGTARTAARSACRSPRRCRRGRGSRRAGGASSAAAARRPGRKMPAEVRRVLERRVEVDVVGDRRTAAAARPCRAGSRRPRGRRGAPTASSVARSQARPSLRQQLVERALAEIDDRVAGAEPEVCRAADGDERSEALRHRTPSCFRSSTGSKKEQLPTATSCSRRTRASSSASATRSRQRSPSARSSTASLSAASSSNAHAAITFRKPWVSLGGERVVQPGRRLERDAGDPAGGEERSERLGGRHLGAAAAHLRPQPPFRERRDLVLEPAASSPRSRTPMSISRPGRWRSVR